MLNNDTRIFLACFCIGTFSYAETCGLLLIWLNLFKNQSPPVSVASNAINSMGST